MKKLFVAMAILMCIALPMVFAGGSAEKDTAEKVDTQISVEEAISTAIMRCEEAGFKRYSDFNIENIDLSRPSTYSTGQRLPQLTIYSTSLSNLLPFDKANSGLTMRLYCYEPLFADYGYNGDGNLVPVVGKEYVNGDNETTITIYDYVYDTEGNHITASDVVFSVNTYIASGYAEFTAYFDKIEVVDDYTVRITWKNDGLNVLGVLESILSRSTIFSEKAWNEHDFTSDPVTTGPYKMGDYVIGAYYEFDANDSYWQKPELTAPSQKRNVQKIRLNVITDDSMKLAAFTSGQVAYITGGEDLLGSFMPGGNLANDPKYTKVYQEGASFCMLLPNLDSPVMKDKNLRLAIFYALDGADLANGLSYMTHTQCYGLEPPLSLDYDSDWDSMKNYQSEYNLELAKEYLSKSSYKGEPIKILVKNHLEKVTVCEVVQQILSASLGLNIEITTTASSTFKSDVAAGNWDIVYDNDNAPNYVSYTLNTRFLASNYKNNKTMNFIDDPVLQQKLEIIGNRTTSSKEALTDLHNYMIENAYGYGICCTTTYFIFDRTFAAVCRTQNTNNFYYGACEYYLD